MFIEGKTMKEKVILNLNKIIYTLITIVSIELSIVSTMMLFNTLFNEPIIFQPVDKIVKKQKVIPPSTLTLMSEVQPKTLDDVLIEISPSSHKDVVSIESTLVKPIIYKNSIKLSTLSIAEKKKTFIDMMIPSILVAKYRISKDRKKVGALLQKEKLLPKESLWLKKKKHIFRASSYSDLYDKMELHPTSIIIAQAIIESGWGTSRFFEEANNVFGIWSFKEYEGRIAASEKRGKHSIYLKKYTSVEQSIFDYFIMLSSKNAYEEFREKRLESKDPFQLVEYLGKYSELGEEYVDNLKNTIRKNKLMVYDSYHLDI